MIESKEFGRIEVTDIPLPEGIDSNVNGTYTPSGRVLAAVRMPEKDEDWYRVFTMEDDGTALCELFDGVIRKKKGANGIRWMCYADNRRILLGDYVLECTPDLDSCTHSKLVEVVLPEEIARIPGVFMRWSEPIIAPDNEHICFSTLTGTGAFNFLGKLVRKEEKYVVEDACLISSVNDITPDPEQEGFFRKNTQRGGEVKQFVKGGRAITLAGGGKSISESTLQMLDSEEFVQITDTLGYEETAIFSPNEKYAVCMSPRFSPKTDCGVLGVVPLYNDIVTRSKYLNVLYQYAIAGVRFQREGNIGPALIDVERSMKEGRQYVGADLSDSEGKWVYYSPISWHPDSTRAMWNESTRLAEGNVKSRLRRCRLLDVKPTEPVLAARTPDKEEIPYARPVSDALKAGTLKLPVKIKGAGGGVVTNSCVGEDTFETLYENYSEDGKTFYDGWIRVKSPANMFMPGETVIHSDINVTGEHTGQMKLRIVLQADERFQIHPDRSVGADGYPKCTGFAEYDGVRRNVEEMAD